MKKGKVGAIRAVEIICVECDEPCVNDFGSYMITEDNETVTCEYCHETYTVPSTAFTPKKLRKKVA